MDVCTHADHIHDVQPREGCEECLKMVDNLRFQYRLLHAVNHVGCCDSSKNKHADETLPPLTLSIIRSLEPGEDWGCNYIDEMEIEVRMPRRSTS